MRWLAVALVLAAGVASAEEPAGDDVRHQQAKELVTSGTEAYAGHRFNAALEAFRKAYDLVPDHKIQFNIGRAALETGDLALAANAFRGFVQGTVAAETLASQRAFAQRELDSLASRISDLHIAVSPSSAAVTVDGAPTPTAPDMSSAADVAVASVYLAPGAHLIAASGAGLTPTSQTIEVRAAEKREVALRLVAPAPVSSLTPEPAPRLDPVADRAPVEQATGPQPAPSVEHVGSWIITGVGVAGLVASGVFYGLATSKHAQAVRDVRAGASYTGDINSADDQQNAAAATLSAGCSGVALGLILRFTTDF